MMPQDLKQIEQDVLAQIETRKQASVSIFAEGIGFPVANVYVFKQSDDRPWQFRFTVTGLHSINFINVDPVDAAKSLSKAMRFAAQVIEHLQSNAAMLDEALARWQTERSAA